MEHMDQIALLNSIKQKILNVYLLLELAEL